jgi:hypothetical protein
LQTRSNCLPSSDKRSRSSAKVAIGSEGYEKAVWRSYGPPRNVTDMASNEKESDLYDKVQDWVTSADGLRCEKAWKDKGLKEARPDVTGLRHAGGHLRGDFELITIEVKTSSSQFLTSAGQAAAYGVYADRAYLCCPRADKPFDEDNIDIASHLGIGLIEIGTHQEIERVLAAPLRQPIPRKRQELLSSLGFDVCQICGIPFPLSGDADHRKGWGGIRREGSRSAISNAVKDGKGFQWWFWDEWVNSYSPDTSSSWNRRYLCSNCVSGVFWDLGQIGDDED